jgi:hypothetical protein
MATGPGAEDFSSTCPGVLLMVAAAVALAILPELDPAARYGLSRPPS